MQSNTSPQPVGPRLPKYVVLTIVGLCLATLVLFWKLASQREQLAMHLDRLAKHEEQLANLRQEFESDEKANRDQLAQLAADLQGQHKQFDDETRSNAERLTALTNEFREEEKRLEVVEALGAQQRESLASLKVDVAKGVQSALTKQVVDAAAQLSLKGIQNDKILINDPVFINAIAKNIVENFRNELRGPTGADADNAVVAKMLSADPDFLNRVSVSVLVQTNGNSALTNR